LDAKDNIVFYGNEFRIKQLITILLDNAIKFTGEGGKIILKLKVHANSIQLSVSDTGEGIAKEHIDKIFDRFYRWTNPVHETTEARDWAWPLPNA